VTSTRNFIEMRYGCPTESLLTSDPSLCTVGHISDDSGRTGELRLDYGNGVLVSLPVHLMRRLQSVLNAAARLVYRLRTRDHITDALISLHWLRVPERIEYQMAILAYRVLHGDAPCYLGPLIRVDDLPGRRPLDPLYQHQPPRGTASETVNSRQPSLCGCGSRHLEQRTDCQLTSSLQIHCQLFVDC